MSFPDLTEPFSRAISIAEQMGGSSPLRAASAQTAKKTGFEAEVEELLLKETKQKQLEEYRADFMSAWLIKRTKTDSSRYNMFGANPSSLSAIHHGDLGAKGTAEDRLVVLTELINLITGAETTGQISGLLEITQQAYDREAGAAGKYSPYIKELYAAGLGLDGISDDKLDKLLAGEKHNGKTYKLEDIANDQRFIIDAHKKMLERKEKLNNLVEDFSYSKLGLLGKFANFNWFGHQMVAGVASGLVFNKALGHSIGFHNLANHAVHTGKLADVIANSSVYKNVVASSFTGKNTTLAKILSCFNRTSFQSSVIGRLGSSGAESAWKSAFDILSKTTLIDGKYSLKGANGVVKTFAADKVDDAAKFLIKSGATSGYANADTLSKLAGVVRGTGKGLVRTLLGRSWKGIGVAALAGAAISGMFWMQEKGGFKASVNELGNKAYDLGKDVLGPLDLVPDYGSWAA